MRTKRESQKVNESFYEAHLRHGREFEVAYRDLVALDPHDRRARALVLRIWNNRDPGKALMSWYKRRRAN
jgi:hypothetical protein